MTLTPRRTLLIVLAATSKLVLSFDHSHQFEHSMNANFDGAVIEVSTDDGATWEDISKYGDPGYGGTIGDPMNQAHNVLKGRQGYVSTNASWPMMDHVTVDLGTKLAGKTALVRFRIGTDEAAGGAGWKLDNLGFDGITNTPFPKLVDDTHTCGGAPDAGPGTGGGGTGGSGGGGTGGADAGPDGGPMLTASGGSGCDCTTGSSTNTNTNVYASLLALAGLVARRRRRSSRSN